MKIKKNKIVTFAVVLLLLVSVGLSGCNSSANAPAQPQDKAAAEQKMSWNPGAEPKTLDPQMSNGIPEAIIELSMFEGLTRLDKESKPIKGIAESWDVSADGMKYTFHLRDAKWTNGDPVTAQDFKTAWLRALDPANAAEYAYQIFYLKNAEAFNGGKAKAEDVGVKVIDPKTLEVTLEAPTPYFLSLTAFPTLFPVNTKVVTEHPKDWNQKVETFVTDGPFKMQQWDHNDKIIVVKNDTYWDAKSVKLSKLTFNLVEDGKAALTAFEQGSLDGTDNIPVEDIQRLRDNKTLITAPYLGTYYYRFNVTKKPFDNVKVRQALAMAIDRKTLIDKVTKGGQTPAFAYVPGGIPDAEAGKTFRQAGGDLFKEDVAKAKQLLADAGYADGKDFPDVSILYNKGASHEVIAQAIQDMWKTNLGISVKLRMEEWKVYQQSEQNLQYDVARAGWIGDYVDPMTFMDMFVTNGGNNQTGWSNAQYDQDIASAKKSGDQKVRMQAMHDAEKILMEQMPVMPIYFYVNNYVAKPYLKDVFRSPLGFIDFKNAWVVEKKS